MTQAIPLPVHIGNEIRNIENVDASTLATVAMSAETKANDYAHEVAIVGIILSDNYMKSIYARSNGYIDSIDTLARWSKEFVTKFAHVEEWEEFIDSNENPYKGTTICWDDVVITFGAEMMAKHEYPILPDNN